MNELNDLVFCSPGLSWFVRPADNSFRPGTIACRRFASSSRRRAAPEQADRAGRSGQSNVRSFWSQTSPWVSTFPQCAVCARAPLWKETLEAIESFQSGSCNVYSLPHERVKAAVISAAQMVLPSLHDEESGLQVSVNALGPATLFKQTLGKQFRQLPIHQHTEKKKKKKKS